MFPEPENQKFTLDWFIDNQNNYESESDASSESDISSEISVVNDSIVNSVIQKFKKRSQFGYQKYGTTLDREDLTLEQWVVHAQEELMDANLYLEKIRQMLIKEKKKEKWYLFFYMYLYSIGLIWFLSLFMNFCNTTEKI